MIFDLYTSDSAGNEKNCLYPNKKSISSPEDLAAAIAKDNVCSAFKGRYRSITNFESCNCIVMDLDNDHSDDPGDWITLEKLTELEPDVDMAIAPSRNHMKEKNGKSPRPKAHAYFPIAETTDPAKVAALKRGIQKKYPFFDGNALDAARFIYGADISPDQIIWQEGWMTIDEAVDPDFSEDEKPAKHAPGIIPMGERNSTLSRFASRVLKKFGDTDQAWDVFLREADKCEIPLPEIELKNIWSSALKFYTNKVLLSSGYVPPDEYNDEFGTPGDLMPEDYSDIGEARVFVREYGDELLFTTATEFMRHDGTVWVESNQKAVSALMEFLDLQLADAMLLCAIRKQAVIDAGAAEDAVEAGTKKAIKEFDEEQMRLFLEYKDALEYYAFVMKRRDMKFITATLQAAKAMLDMSVNDLDSDPYLLNTPDGTLDLRKGVSSLRPHEPGDHITKITAVAPSDEGRDLWLDQLNKTFKGNQETIEYTQMVFGEAMFGLIENERLLIGYGGGRNGKSTVCNSVARCLGTYSGVISSDVLTAGVRRNVKPEIAEIKGKRLLIAGELEEGTRLSTAIVKQLCSTDPIKGEKKYKTPFDFIPSHSLILYTNHLPKVGAVDDGIWRRLVVIPFNAKFEGKSDIKNYTEHLVKNAGGYILKWLIEGAEKAYKADFKTPVPPEVRSAIDKYRQDNDWFTDFLEDCCEVDKTFIQKSGELYNAYRNYCFQTGNVAKDSATFYSTLEQKGFFKRRKTDGNYIFGLHLKEKTEEEFF